MRRLPLAVVLGAGLLAGCGGSGGGKPEVHAVTVPASRGVSLTAREYSFRPNAITATGAGGKQKLTLHNEGSLPHDVHVLKGDRDLGGTPPFEKGTRSAELVLPPGRYRLICTIGEHAKLGMRASLEVKK
jgi:plastocyanin